MRSTMGNDFPNGSFPNGDSFFQGFNIAARTFEPWMRGWARANLECLTLSSRRTRAYLELPEQLGRCRTPQDFANETVGFWQVMVRDYAESSQRLAAGWSSIL